MIFEISSTDVGIKKTQKITSIDENVEKLEFSYVTDRNVK